MQVCDYATDAPRGSPRIRWCSGTSGPPMVARASSLSLGGPRKRRPRIVCAQILVHTRIHIRVCGRKRRRERAEESERDGRAQQRNGVGCENTIACTSQPASQPTRLSEQASEREREREKENPLVNALNITPWIMRMYSTLAPCPSFPSHSRLLALSRVVNSA